MSLSVASNWFWDFWYWLRNPLPGRSTGVNTVNLRISVLVFSNVFHLGWNLYWIFRLHVRYFFIPELKGLSSEQVDVLYRQSLVIGSAAYHTQMIAQSETFNNHLQEKAIRHATDKGDGV